MRPMSMSVYEIVTVFRARGDTREDTAISQQIIRAIHDGSLTGAEKVNKDKQTSPWQVPVESVEAWLDAKS